MRIGFGMLIVFFAASILAGMLIMWGLYYVFLLLFRENELKENSKEVDIMERWAKGENEEG
jgi:uncharacterized membrane protein